MGLGRAFAITAVGQGTGELDVPVPSVTLPTPSRCRQRWSELAAPGC